MAQPIGVMYATAGGRYPFLAGVAEVLESYLIKMGYNIVFRMGASGGSLISALQATGTSFSGWIETASTPEHRSQMKIGGLRYLSNLWSYVREGGFIRSEVVASMFENTITNPLASPTYAVSWCSSQEKPVAFRLTDENLASRVSASCALPVGITPVKIRNGDLEPRIQEQLGVQAEPDAFSTFRDGGLCSGFPLRLIEGITAIPVVVVCIDHRIPGKNTSHASVFQQLLAREMRVKIMDNLNEIASRRSLSVFCVPCPDFLNRKYAVKFDLTKDEGMEMYNTGRVLAESQLFLHGLQLPKPEEVPTPAPIAVEAPVEAQELIEGA